MARRKRILFFTNSDFGQANVVLATAHALLHIDPQVEIHIASFRPLEEEVKSTSAFALKAFLHKHSKPIIFHPLDGISWGPATFRPEVGVAATNDLNPGLINSAKNILLIPSVMLPWRPDEFTSLYRQAESILADVQPDVTAIDPIFTPALTLCHHLKTNWLVLAPNTLKDFALPMQPNLAMLWKYPLVCSALPYPLPWSLTPLNILLNLVAAYALLTNPRIRATTAHLRRHTNNPNLSLMTANEMGVLRAPPAGLRVLCAISSDLDYPLSIIPPHLVPCGPIVRAVGPVEGPLREWLARGRTLYVNLGTHLRADVVEAGEMAGALRDVLDRAEAVGYGRLQVLWKLGRKKTVGGEEVERDRFEGKWQGVCDVLRPEIEDGRVKVTDWVDAEPKAVLESGGVVLLPPWSDCYDFANRVEMLGIGRWANKEAKPRWKRDELATCLEDVLFGPEADKIREKARELAMRHPESAGRERAACEILASV
ncbi:hypothetical protein C8A01DRAFT_49169 [Parachaetomium inaequale]|uniref:Uncharacterized protein n=1 Tax=Parachaetomium inaequale TaxID=2588326 RepID=A0AAN6PCX5_9PEZI|nr:hypothetical protein C8A01DRAFT_49169 [Parachaetomium inaequale]